LREIAWLPHVARFLIASLVPGDDPSGFLMRSNGGPLGQRCLDDRSHGDRLFEAAFLRFGILLWREQGELEEHASGRFGFSSKSAAR